MKYEGSYKRLDVTTYVIQVCRRAGKMLCKSCGFANVPESYVALKEGHEENPRALQHNFKSG